MDLQHHGIARVSIEGDLATGQQYMPQALHLLQGLLDRLKVGGIQSGAAALRLDENSYAYARVAGSINAVRVVVGSQIDLVFERRVSIGAPDFISGIVTDGRMKTRQNEAGQPVHYVAGFYPTSQTAQTHPDLLPNQAQGVDRLGVRPHSSHSEWESQHTTNTQYRQCRATLYTGKMKRVVQALMGFGKQMPTVPRAGEPVVDEDGPVNPSRTRSIYAKVFSMLAEDAPRRQPTEYEREVASAGLQIRYDYRFMRSHGVHVAVDGALWLVEIGMTRGVLAMPLPLHELTRRPPPPAPGESPQRWRFREELEALEVLDAAGEPRIVRDVDGIRMLEEFGGFPTGEGFPEGDALQSAIRAGEVLELLSAEDLAPFYRHNYYSSSMGWAFSESGAEAHNTGYRFEDSDIGYQIGVHYAIDMRIGATQSTPSVPGAAGVSERVYRAQGVDPKKRAILARKALRLTEAQVRGLTENELTDATFIEQLDGLTVTPIAAGSAGLRLQRESYMVNPGRSPPTQIKFHEPLIGYLISHDFHPANGDHIPPPKRSNAAMHVFFDGEELKWVRYFYDPHQAPTRIEDEQEPCMFVGTWSRVVTTGPREVSRAFYSSDFDDRAVLGETVTTTLWKGSYFGATEVLVVDDPADFRRNYATRRHTFIMQTRTTTESGKSVGSGVAVPYGIREAYYMAFMDYAETYSSSLSYSYRHLADPYSAEGWRCIVSTAGFAHWPNDMAGCPPGCDEQAWNRPGGTPPDDNPRVARFVRYDPGPCSDVVDKGPWVFKCDNLDSMSYSIPLPDPPPTVFENVPRKARLTIRFVGAIGPRNVETRVQDFQNTAWVMPRWFIPSPDDFGFMDFIAAGGNALGESEAAVLDRDLNFLGGVLRYGFPTYEGMDGSNACYIGVV